MRDQKPSRLSSFEMGYGFNFSADLVGTLSTSPPILLSRCQFSFTTPLPPYHLLLIPPFPSRNDVIVFNPHNTSSRSKTGASVKLRFLSQIKKNVS